jgi:hypothetical protein
MRRHIVGYLPVVERQHPDDVPAHPYAIAMDAAILAAERQGQHVPGKEPKEWIPLAIRQIRSFLRAHRMTVATA